MQKRLCCCCVYYLKQNMLIPKYLLCNLMYRLTHVYCIVSLYVHSLYKKTFKLVHVVHILHSFHLHTLQFTFILFSGFSFSFVLLSRQKCSHSKWTKNSIFHALSGSVWPRRHTTLCPKFSNFHPKIMGLFSL